MKKSKERATILSGFMLALFTSAPLALAAQPERWGVIDATGKVVVAAEMQNAAQAEETVSKLIRAKAPSTDNPFPNQRSGGTLEFVSVIDPPRSTYKHKVLGVDGKQLALTDTDSATYLNPQRWILSELSRSPVLMDASGNRLKEFPTESSLSSILNSNRFLIKEDNNYKLYDDDGVLVKDLGDCSAVDTLDERTFVGSFNNVFQLRDYNGNLIATLAGVTDVDASGSDKIFAAEFAGDKHGYFNYKGQKLGAARFTTAGEFTNGFAEVAWTDAKKKNHCGFIDRTGKIVIDRICDDIWGLGNDRVFIHTPAGFYLIDTKTGRTVTHLPASTVTVDAFHDGLAAITSEPPGAIGKYEQPSARATISFIDAAGKVVIPPRAPAVYAQFPRFSAGVIPIRQGDRSFGLWGYMNTKGNIVVQPQFYNAEDLRGGLGIFCLREQGFDKQEFDRQLIDAHDWRDQQASYFLVQNDIIGMTKAAVHDALGLPTSTDPNVDDYLTIPGICSLSSEAMQFKYSNGKVVAYRIAHGAARTGPWSTKNNKSTMLAWVRLHAAK